jgi:hypothetical protein
MEFNVPALQGNAGLIAEVRYRLMEPHAPYASSNDRHE